jgi:hypothetical protein
MFICYPCLSDRCEGSGVSYAKMTIEIGRGSLGPCELCRNTRPCADIPSGGAWRLKKETS